MTVATPLPVAQEVRELVEGLLGRTVEARPAHLGVDLKQNRENLVGTYVTDGGYVAALVLVDLAAAARLGAALGLAPRSAADDAVKSGLLPVQLGDNVAEVLNVAASLFNADGAPHLRLLSVYGGDVPAPADVAQWARSFAPRVDLELDISGYGTGGWSVVLR
ncbi:MAG TPA: hypothetical protein VGC04_05125 [Cellulomonas sp.]